MDNVAEAFVRHAIYSIGDLYFGYDEFQFASESKDLTTMRTPLEFMRMCTLPQGATNLVAHMHEKTIPFVDDIPINGYKEAVKHSTFDADGCI